MNKHGDMAAAQLITTELTIDRHKQWFATLDVAGSRKSPGVPIDFKVDTGCNALVLSRSSLELLGYQLKDISSWQDVKAIVGSGHEMKFKQVPDEFSLFIGHIHIFSCNAICHAKNQTHDLLGTNVLSSYKGVAFTLAGKNKRVGLTK